MGFEVLDPNNTCNQTPYSNLFPLPFSHRTTRTCQSHQTELTYACTRGAASVLDNCLNVMLRPSPSLHDTQSFNQPILVNHLTRLASIASFRGPGPTRIDRSVSVRSCDVSKDLVRISPFEA